MRAPPPKRCWEGLQPHLYIDGWLGGTSPSNKRGEDAQHGTARSGGDTFGMGLMGRLDAAFPVAASAARAARAEARVKKRGRGPALHTVPVRDKTFQALRITGTVSPYRGFASHMMECMEIGRQTAFFL